MLVVFLAIFAVLVATPLLLLAAVVLGPVALAAAGILLVAGLVLAGLAVAEAISGARFGPFPKPTGWPRPQH